MFDLHISSTPQPTKWSALARATHTSLTSSASTSALPPPSSTARAASSSSARKRYLAIPMMAIRWLAPSRHQATHRQYDRMALHADAGYRGHNAPPRLQVQNLYIQAKEQKRRVPHRSNE